MENPQISVNPPDAAASMWPNAEMFNGRAGLNSAETPETVPPEACDGLFMVHDPRELQKIWTETAANAAMYESRGCMDMIAAITLDGGLSRGGVLPWNGTDYAKLDMYWFRTFTKSKTVVMGRKTWESIGEAPLSSRRNIVVSSRAGELYDKYMAAPTKPRPSTRLIFVYTPEQAVAISRGLLDGYGWNLCRSCVVIGGADIYGQFVSLGLVRHAYITIIPGDYSCDTFMPIAKLDELAQEVYLSAVVANTDDNSRVLTRLTGLVPGFSAALSRAAGLLLSPRSIVIPLGSATAQPQPSPSPGPADSPEAPPSTNNPYTFVINIPDNHGEIVIVSCKF